MRNTLETLEKHLKNTWKNTLMFLNCVLSFPLSYDGNPLLFTYYIILLLILFHNDKDLNLNIFIYNIIWDESVHYWRSHMHLATPYRWKFGFKPKTSPFSQQSFIDQNRRSIDQPNFGLVPNSLPATPIIFLTVTRIAPTTDIIHTYACKKSELIILY